MRVVLVGFGILAAVCAAVFTSFVVTPIEPFAYYKDLGFNWEVIEWAAHLVQKPVDAFDSAGWSPWMNVQLLYLNPNVGDVVGIIISKLVGNSWSAVKIVEVLQTAVAGAGAYAMYATASSSKTWRSIFAALYATLPLNALMIRGNEDFGWIFALAPVAVTVTRLLLRRYGARALPMAAIVASLAGFLIAIQYVLFTSIPLLLLAVTGMPRALKSRGALFYLFFGLIACLTVGAFYIVPTFVHPMLSDSAPRSESLATNQFLAFFSLDWVGLLTLIEREYTLSPIRLFNVSDTLPILYVPMAILWCAAIGHIATARRNAQTWADPFSTSIVFFCAVLALGSTIPLGSKLWSLLYAIPHVNGIRTVDRFLAITPLFILFWAVSGFERMATAKKSLRIASATTLLAITICFMTFDRLQGSFTLDDSISFHEPQLQSVRNIVVGDRTDVASFASVNEGSVEDAPMYGRPQPVSWLTTDLQGRFLFDGVGASGMLGRAGVGDVVTSPSWTFDAPSLPNTSNIYRLVPRATPRFTSPENVNVWSIPHRRVVTPVHLDCVHGGPGAFDVLATRKELEPVAFKSIPTGCSVHDFVDYDPADGYLENPAIETWSGRALRAGNGLLQDADYAIFWNRTLVNIPWYRNAVDGERPVFDESGASRIITDTAFSLPSHRAWTAGTTLCVRIASHDAASIALRLATGDLYSSTLVPRYGFVWSFFKLKQAVPADTNVRFSVELSPNSGEIEGWGGIALDGIAAVPPALAMPSRPARTGFIAATLSRFAPRTAHKASSPILLGPENTANGAHPIRMDAMHASIVDGSSAYVASGNVAKLQYRWNGPAGTYIMKAEGRLAPNATLGIGTTASGDCCSVTRGSSATGEPTTVLTVAQLRPGSLLQVEIVTAPFRASAGNRVTSVSLTPIRPLVLDENDKTDIPRDFHLNDPAQAMSLFSQTTGVTFEPDGVHGRAGARAVISFALLGRPRVVVARIASAGTDAEGDHAMLRCSSRADDERVTSLTVLTVSDDKRFRSCTMTIEWTGSAMTIPELTIGIAGTDARSFKGLIWTPAGRFTVAVIRSNGREDHAAILKIPYCSELGRLCAFRSGFHSFELSDGALDDAMLTFESTTVRPSVPHVTVTATSALRWNIDVDEATDLAVSKMNDGNWVLANERTTMSADSCDIVDSCFTRVLPGHYHLYHRWSSQLWSGMIATTTTILLSALLLVKATP